MGPTIPKSARPSARRIATLAAAIALVVVAALLLGYAGQAFITYRAGHKAVGSTPSLAVAASPSSDVAVIPLLDQPRAVANVEFAGADGASRSLADFHGKVVLLNVWATWCLPCREEIPSLDRLQAEIGSPDFEVVALSIDRGGAEVVREFYDEVGVSGLALYVDASGEAGPALNVVGLPTTLLIDREGRELGRLVGPAEWDAPDMIGFLADVVASQVSARPGPVRGPVVASRSFDAAPWPVPTGSWSMKTLTFQRLEAPRLLPVQEEQLS